MKAIDAGTDRAYTIGIGAQFDLEGLATDVTDLLANLRHLCDVHQLDFAWQDKRAYEHYCAEVSEDRRAKLEAQQ